MRKRASIALLAYAALLSCRSVEETPITAIAVAHYAAVAPFDHYALSSAASPNAHVVIVAIDGARWQEIFGGTDSELARSNGLGASVARAPDELVPNIRALARRGVSLGADAEGAFEASGPNFVSLPGYTEILTGRPAPCQENACEARPERTLADEMRALPNVGRRDVAVLSSWERIDAVAASDPDNVVVSAGRSHGATRELLADDPATGDALRAGERSTAFPGHDDYRPDRHTIAIATSYFEHQRPRFLFVSLGDTDEYAHAGSYRGYLDALEQADAFVGDLVRISRAWGSDGNDVVFFVTTDHGRSVGFRDHGRSYPESGRSWLVAAGTPLVSPFAPSIPLRGHLRDIAPTVREIVGITPDADRLAGRTLTELFDPRGSCVALRD